MLLVACCAPFSAAAASGLKIVSYHGYRVAVPRAWPVYDLARDPAVCVRFNRHAVYLGRPSANQQCPAHAAGRRDAILLEPISAGVASAGRAGMASAGRAGVASAGRAGVASAGRAGVASAGGATGITGLSGPGTAGGSGGSLVNTAHGIVVTATWNRDGATIRHALGVRSLDALHPGSNLSGPRDASVPPMARISSASPAIPGGIYTGLGFDACSTPSTAHMSAWGSSRYQAVGVYIGGTNMACAQPNLTPAWVSQESAAGWHLVPIYVGLQAPSNSCGCAAISSGKASAQGQAAASDAVNRAQRLGLGPGNPIYFDMEAYPRGGGTSSAVLSFLAGWTTQLNAEGYKSGVYSSVDSGIRDLVSQAGTGYSEPDELWFANWNGIRSTGDPAVPSGDWPNHQRLHQYQGGHDETHGGVKINIDGNYLDAATAAAGSTANAASEPAASSPPTVYGKPVEGQTLSEAHGNWPGAPASYIYEWEDCNRAGYNCVTIPGATAQSYTLRQSDVGHMLRIIETASYAGGLGIPATSGPTSLVLTPNPLYWLFSASGKVYGSVGTSLFGSPWGAGFRDSRVTGMAGTADGQGYWLASAGGTVLAFGDAANLPSPQHKHPIRGIVAAPGGGYWLYTARGNVYASSGAAWYGAPSGSGFRGSSIVGMAATADGKGYWLVSAAGRVFAYGDAANLTPPRHRHPVRGIVAAPGGGYWLYTSNGNVLGPSGTAWFGSPSASRIRVSSIVGMAPSADRQGYWLVTAAGTVFAYGDAARLPAAGRAHRIAGIAGS